MYTGAWTFFLDLLNWGSLRDTIPMLLILLVLCSLNKSFLPKSQYIKKFAIYCSMSYVFYFSHIWMLSLEEKLFNGKLPIFYTVVSYFIGCELRILLIMVDNKLGIKIPFLSKFLSNKKLS